MLGDIPDITKYPTCLFLVSILCVHQNISSQ